MNTYRADTPVIPALPLPRVTLPGVIPALPLPRVTLPGVSVDNTLDARELMERGKIHNAKMQATAYRFVLAMRKLGKPIYLNTVPAKTIADRRRSDKFAAASRKANR